MCTMQSKLGLELCRHMLFIHAFSDISRIFHIGKNCVFSKTFRRINVELLKMQHACEESCFVQQLCLARKQTSTNNGQIPSDMDQVPELFVRIIHCNYKAGCTTNRCSCVKYGLPCKELAVYVFAMDHVSIGKSQR